MADTTPSSPVLASPYCEEILGHLTFSPHVGAHAGAPMHCAPAGAAIGCGPPVKPEHLVHAMDRIPARVLVRVCDRMPRDRFDNALPAFAPETINRLAAAELLLIGAALALLQRPLQQPAQPAR